MIDETPDMQFLAGLLLKLHAEDNLMTRSELDRLRAIRDEKVGLGTAPSPYNHYALPWRGAGERVTS